MSKKDNVVRISDAKQKNLNAENPALDEAVELMRGELDAGPARAYDTMKNVTRWLEKHPNPEELALQAMKQLGVMASLPGAND